jgi:hypothetical protein
MATHRSIIAALAAAVTLTACDSATTPTAPPAQLRVEDAGHNAALHFSSTTALDETLESPCNGETIHLTGTARDQMTVVGVPEDLPDNWLHAEHSGVVSESGTGLTTGLPYQFRDSFHEIFNSPSVSAANFVFHTKETGRVTTTEPGLSFTLHFAFYAVGLPSGEIKVTREIESLECH